MTVLYMWTCRRCRRVSDVDNADVEAGLIPVHTCGRRMCRATDEDLERFVYAKKTTTNRRTPRG